jgi:hypothetical protein
MAKTLITNTTAAAPSDSIDINIDNKPVTPAAFDQGNYPHGDGMMFLTYGKSQ